MRVAGGCGPPLVPGPLVEKTIWLVGGQAAAIEPAGQLAGVVEEISTFSGAKEQETRLGRLEQDKVTNMGDVRAALSTGVTVTMSEPDWPAVSDMGSVVGEMGASET